jgi:protein-tyrosine phosphatase
MPTFTWWIDEPLLKGSSNPTDEDLESLRAQGFSVAVSLLDDSKQPPQYDERIAEDCGWLIHSIPIAENNAPSLEQIRDFMTRLTGLLEGTKVLVFCESGIGRTACMAAAYWITRGLTSSAAIRRISEACSASDWVTPERQRVLEDYEAQRNAGTKQPDSSG